MSNAAQLRSVLRLLALLPPDSGFEPYSLCAFAYGPDGGGEYVRRSLRYEFGTCCTHLTIEASRRSPWRAGIVRDLARAGYEPWFALDGSVDVRRWLRTAAERRRELALLRELGMHGDPVRWPPRRVRRAPRPNFQHREPRAAWVRVARQICGAGFTWEDVSLCLSRSGERAAPTASGTLSVTVSVMPYVLEPPKRRFVVTAGVHDPGRGSDTTPLAPRVARIVRRVLRDAGLRPDGARSTQDGKVLRDRVGYDRTITGARDAARACQQVFEALMSVPLPEHRTTP